MKLKMKLIKLLEVSQILLINFFFLLMHIIIIKMNQIYLMMLQEIIQFQLEKEFLFIKIKIIHLILILLEELMKFYQF